MKKFTWLTIVFVVAFTIQASVVLGSGSQYDINSPKVKEIASQLSMQGHGDHDISTCQTMQTYYNEIVELLNEGMRTEEVLLYYESMFGEEGFKAPKKEGFSLLAWVTPFIVLGAASLVLFIAIKKMVVIQRNYQSQLAVSPVTGVEEEIVKSLIDEERKKYF